MYLSGFGNFHQTEAKPGTLPKLQNSPQHCSYGLYAEQISGSAFTRKRHQNLHTWVYRCLPSVVHSDYEPYQSEKKAVFLAHTPPNPYRWSPFSLPKDGVDFIDGLIPIAGNQQLLASIYQCNRSMVDTYFINHDGELLFVPYLGNLELATELGALEIKPGQIAVIPRGIAFKVLLNSHEAAGYLCENRAIPLTLPELGTIGANGLANPRHFLYPTAAFDAKEVESTLIARFQGQLWSCKSRRSPLSIVAWQGNYAPYSYDLALFNTINTVSFDHPDPSIFTVLTAESTVPGIADLDFVIFPPRFMVADHTFRPPYFHKNCMNEWMGLIQGSYDAKKEGFLPGGISIHNCMTAHGPDSQSYLDAVTENLVPKRYENTLAFMFESKDPWELTEGAYAHKARQKTYSSCWQDLKSVAYIPST